MNKAIWNTHEFTVLQKQASWHDVAGIYIFCGITPQNQWKPYYIGQADSFLNRIPNHERWDEAVQLGATHVHAMVVSEAVNRDAIEQALIRSFQPVLNTQHR